MDSIDFVSLSKGMSMHHDTDLYPTRGFHTHDIFEVVVPVKGEFLYLVEKNVYHLKERDVLIVSNVEVHKPAPCKSNEGTERILIHIYPVVQALLNTNSMNLTACFTQRPLGEGNKVTLSKNQWAELIKLINRVELSQADSAIGCEVIKSTRMLELLTFINRLYIEPAQIEQKLKTPEKLAPIVDFIERHLAENLSLESLEQKFFINRFYLSKHFKEKMGINVHEYIMLRRISLSKRLLSEGLSVTEVCQQAGFNDYANFIRCFKNVTGLPPGKYAKLQKSI